MVVFVAIERFLDGSFYVPLEFQQQVVPVEAMVHYAIGLRMVGLSI